MSFQRSLSLSPSTDSFTVKAVTHEPLLTTVIDGSCVTALTDVTVAVLRDDIYEASVLTL